MSHAPEDFAVTWPPIRLVGQGSIGGQCFFGEDCSPQAMKCSSVSVFLLSARLATAAAMAFKAPQRFMRRQLQWNVSMFAGQVVLALVLQKFDGPN